MVPHPLPPSQQHSDLVTMFLLLEVIWHSVVRTSVKQKPSRLSEGWSSQTEREKKNKNKMTNTQKESLGRTTQIEAGLFKKGRQLIGAVSQINGRFTEPAQVFLTAHRFSLQAYF